jgi:hypothetical protein
MKFDRLVEAYMQVVNESRTPEQVAQMKADIARYTDLNDPEWDYADGGETSTEDYNREIEEIEARAKAGGYLDHLERAADIGHFGRGMGRSNTGDILKRSSYEPGPRITKAGKMNKTDVQGLKSKIKSRQSWDHHGIQRPLP